MTDARKVKWILAFGVLCISFPAILVRFTDAPPLAAAFWRKGLAALFLLPLVLRQLRRGRVDGAALGSLAPSFFGTGLLLSVHFALWFISLRLTSVSSSVVLVNTAPVWSAILGWFFLKERVPVRDAVAIGVAFAGVGFLGWGDWAGGPRALLGDALALCAGFCAAAYLTAGRGVRDRLPLAQWLFGVYGLAALFLAAGALATGQAFSGYDGRTWAMLLLMAAVPSTLGHNLLNYAVRHMPAYRVNLCVLAETAVSTTLAAALFHEYPTALFFPGAALIFLGIWLGMRGGTVEDV